MAERYGLNIALKLLKQLGGWPVLDMYWSDSNFEWTRNIAALRQIGLPVNSLLEISVGFDFKHSTSRLVQVCFKNIQFLRLFYLRLFLSVFLNNLFKLASINTAHKAEN